MGRKTAASMEFWFFKTLFTRIAFIAIYLSDIHACFTQRAEVLDDDGYVCITKGR